MRHEALVRIVSALNTSGARYLLVGGVAVIAHGYVRTTVNCDLVLDLDPANVLKALKAFETLGYRSRVPLPMIDFANAALRERWAAEKHMVVFTLVNPDHELPDVDLFTRVPFDFDLEKLRGSVYRLAREVSAPVISLETLLAMKKDAGRLKDQADIEYLTTIHSSLERPDGPDGR